MEQENEELPNFSMEKDFNTHTTRGRDQQFTDGGTTFAQMLYYHFILFIFIFFMF